MALPLVVPAIAGALAPTVMRTAVRVVEEMMSGSTFTHAVVGAVGPAITDVGSQVFRATGLGTPFGYTPR